MLWPIPQAPGLVGALLVGATVGAFSGVCPGTFRRSPVHHMEGHLLAPMLEDNPPEFPFVALLVSGGHTQLISVTGIGQYELLGESIDDAAGEAFDKNREAAGAGLSWRAITVENGGSGYSRALCLPAPDDRPSRGWISAFLV